MHFQVLQVATFTAMCMSDVYMPAHAGCSDHKCMHAYVNVHAVVACRLQKQADRIRTRYI
jgi:hypothetical protein